jgi:ribosomal protein S18 acetylase RimI-like enzyme
MAARLTHGTIIRRLEKKDCRAAADFCAMTTAWMHRKYLRMSYPKEAAEFDVSIKTAAKLAERLKKPDDCDFLAVSDDGISGILLGMVFGKSGLAKVEWIAVDPDHQHEGIGIALMTAAEEEFLKRGCHKIYLNTLPALVPAIRLYMKFGLLPESYLRKHWWGADFILMSKWIGEYRRKA